ncbi:MAG: 30S ribosomal protein S12 methylthiotransferase RimO [Firmicutes bacterium]|nr:30S ribosomal protein S12 methylthiotransferase RimO [Bacillota bacterium]
MKIYIETLGCPKNTVDSENAAAMMKKAGHTIINSPEDANLIMVNTCAFINDAKTESIETILDMAQLKENGDKILMVSGCLSQRYSEELFNEIPEADIFIGVNEYDKINEIINEYTKEKRLRYAKDAPADYCEIPDREIEPSSVSAYLRIAEGCDNVCSYCVIPSIRGPYRSRLMESITEEAERLAEQGVKELVLVAQDVTAYGRDIYGGYALHELLSKLCEIEKLRWIRLLYCYEDSITDELISVMADEEKICKYIDIPLQHVNDKILSSMNRRSTGDSIRAVIKKLRERIPDIHIRTTFITGFPGEGEKEFNELVEFIEETEFERMGAFSYSMEENTPAADMPDQVEQETKERRRDILMDIQREISLKNNTKKIGEVMEVLVDEVMEDGTYMGRTRFDAPEIDNGVIFTSESKLAEGQFVNVEITDAFDYDLVGKAVKI